MVIKPNPVFAPVLWLNLRGDIVVAGQIIHPQINSGVFKGHIPEGIAYRFAGQKSGILFGDMPALRLGGSLTVAAWLNPGSYVNDGSGGQILFRGDDRNGLDPYTFVLEGDGTVNFTVSDAAGLGMKLKTEIPLNRWTHVTANFNAETGDMNMWLNGELLAYTRTSHRPYIPLDAHYTPGVGIGNVQNDRGPHNQPYRGLLADLRLYNVALRPEQAGFQGRVPGVEPPEAFVDASTTSH